MALWWLQQNLNQISNSQQAPHTSPSRPSYGVSIVRIREKIDRIITAPHCIMNQIRTIIQPNQHVARHNCVHYSDVIMDAMASQIISLTIIYSTVYLGTDKKTSVTGKFPAQRASHVENVSIWWCHHDILLSVLPIWSDVVTSVQLFPDL